MNQSLFFLLVALLLSGKFAFAGPYIPFDQYLEKASEDRKVFLLNYVASVIKFEASGQSCTATAVSNEGHYLSATHCLVPCLQSRGVVLTKGGFLSAKTFEILPSKPQYEVLFHCSAQVNDMKGVSMMKEDLKVLGLVSRRGISDATFEGYTGSLHLRYRKELKKILDSGFTASMAEGDMVLFQLKNYRSQKCARFSSAVDFKKIEQPGSLVSIGFPGGLGPLGNSIAPMVSEGMKTSGIDALPNYTYIKESAWEAMKGYAERPHSFLANLDLLPGASGAAAVDLVSGEIVGVGSFQLMAVDYFIPGNSFFVDASRGFLEIAKSLPGKDFESIKSCKGLMPLAN